MNNFKLELQSNMRVGAKSYSKSIEKLPKVRNKFVLKNEINGGNINRRHINIYTWLYRQPNEQKS
jgi:hypothetical protein